VIFPLRNFCKVAFLAICEIFLQFQRGPTWPNVNNMPMSASSASSSGMLVDCIGNSLLFTMAVADPRLRFIK